MCFSCKNRTRARGSHLLVSSLCVVCRPLSSGPRLPEGGIAARPVRDEEPEMGTGPGTGPRLRPGVLSQDGVSGSLASEPTLFIVTPDHVLGEVINR